MEQSSIQVQHKKEALWGGERVGDGMSIVEVSRGRDWNRKANLEILAISHRTRQFASRG